MARPPLLEALRDKPIRWVTQISINAAHDEAYVAALARAGCKGVLIGFESLNEDNLKAMNKRFNSMKTGFSGALANLRQPVDAFFDKVLVNSEVEAERDNRLRLLTKVRDAMERLADFSQVTG